MTAACRDLFDETNSGDAHLAARNAQAAARSARLGSYQDRLRRSITSIFGTKAVFAIVGNCFIKERHAQKIVSGELRMSADVLVGLLRSDEGYSVLRVIMDGCKADWWRGIADAYDDIELSKQISVLKEQRRRKRGVASEEE